MKKINLLLIALVVLLNTASAQIDNLSNMSAEWMRSGVRNAAVDAADMVVYNPAGITSLNDGLHINFSNQSLFRKPSHSYDLGLGDGQKTYSQKSPDLFLPNLYMAYKKKNWAVFTGVYFSGGGATADYSDGSITTDLLGLGALSAAQGAYTSTKNPMLKASSMYLTTTLGGSYEVKKGLSFSVAMKYLNAMNTSEAGVTLTSSPMELPDMPLNLKTETNASGIGGVFAVSYTGVDHLSLSARYESKVNLDFKTKQLHDDFGLTVDGQMNRRDLPAVGAFGAAYSLTSKLKVMADYTFYFQKNANWGKTSTATNEQSYSALAGNAAIYACGLQYKFTDKLLVSTGVGFTKMNFKDKAAYYENLGTFEVVQSDNTNLNVGFAYKPGKKITVNVGYMHVFYPTDQTINAVIAQPLDVKVKMNNSMNAFAVGIDLAF